MYRVLCVDVFFRFRVPNADCVSGFSILNNRFAFSKVLIQSQVLRLII